MVPPQSPPPPPSSSLPWPISLEVSSASPRPKLPKVRVFTLVWGHLIFGQCPCL